MMPLSDAKILDSWNRNAAAWTDAVRKREIESRRLVTDQAVIDAILEHAPRTAIDLGCGEGWLVRELTRRGLETIGIDAVPDLVREAQRAGSGQFKLLSYDDIAAGELALTADAVICNFALLGRESVDHLIAAIPRLLTPHGRLIVQTLHPVAACGPHPYQDGWRAGSWDGFSARFVDPAPWYFRTLGSWIALLADNDLRLLEIREPLHPETRHPASVIFIAERDPAHRDARSAR